MEAVSKQVAHVGKTRHPLKSGLELEYGTSGFRANAEQLDHIMYRMGVLAAIRAILTNEATGVMMTASHNPAEYNGIKLIEPNGAPPDKHWEQVANQLVLASDEDLGQLVLSLCNQSSPSSSLQVCLGRDTRASGVALLDAVKDGVVAMGLRSRDFGVVSTPQLNFIVTKMGKKDNADKSEDELANLYFEKLGKAFQHATGKYDVTQHYEPRLILDASNGVGAFKMRSLQPYLADLLEVRIVNDGADVSDVLNEMCGADHVKTTLKPAKGLESTVNERCASVDGDMDRVVYWYLDERQKLHLLDGDKIAALVAISITDLLQAVPKELNLAVIQTAYANGKATDYLKNQLECAVECVATGVKNLHRRAQDFDIGIYYEANGHGTVLFSEKALLSIKEEAWQTNSVRAQKLLGLIDLINRTSTDGLSNLLLVEALLRDKGWSVQDWDAIYEDRPSQLRQIRTKNSHLLKTTENECKLIEPRDLQAKIDQIVSEFEEARAFVRASGTETNVVRIYVEAKTEEQVQNLAQKVAEEVEKVLGK